MDIMTGDILDTIQIALKMTERDQFIDYLVNQAKQIRDNSLLEAVAPHCVFPPQVQTEINEFAQHYLCMLKQAIQRWNPHVSEDTALNCASAIHCLISSYTQSSVAQYVLITTDGLQMLIEKLMILE